MIVQPTHLASKQWMYRQVWPSIPCVDQLWGFNQCAISVIESLQCIHIVYTYTHVRIHVSAASSRLDHIHWPKAELSWLGGPRSAGEHVNKVQSSLLCVDCCPWLRYISQVCRRGQLPARWPQGPITVQHLCDQHLWDCFSLLSCNFFCANYFLLSLKLSARSVFSLLCYLATLLLTLYQPTFAACCISDILLS